MAVGAEGTRTLLRHSFRVQAGLQQELGFADTGLQAAPDLPAELSGFK